MALGFQYFQAVARQSSTLRSHTVLKGDSLCFPVSHMSFPLHLYLLRPLKFDASGVLSTTAGMLFLCAEFPGLWRFQPALSRTHPCSVSVLPFLSCRPVPVPGPLLAPAPPPASHLLPPQLLFHMAARLPLFPEMPL